MDRTSFSSNFINEFENLNKALNPTVHTNYYQRCDYENRKTRCEGRSRIMAIN